jgi:DNA-binding MarR family transcriptional regulator
MNNAEKEFLMNISAQEKQYDALYRGVASRFGMPDCAMWVLYFLIASDETLTQQDLIERMMFPKQTINSAVMGLAKKGLLELRMIPGTRNRKRILLTESGVERAHDTVERMRQAEERAAAGMGSEKTEQFAELYREFFSALQREFQKEGLADE